MTGGKKERKEIIGVDLGAHVIFQFLLEGCFLQHELRTRLIL